MLGKISGYVSSHSLVYVYIHAREWLASESSEGELARAASREREREILGMKCRGGCMYIYIYVYIYMRVCAHAATRATPDPEPDPAWLLVLAPFSHLSSTAFYLNSRAAAAFALMAASQRQTQPLLAASDYRSSSCESRRCGLLFG